MKSEIDRFLGSGDYDLLMSNWPGAHSLDRIARGDAAMRDALLAEVRRREARVTIPTPAVVAEGDLPAFARAKLAPMVQGLFPRVEQQPVLNLLERSVVFLTSESIEPQAVISFTCRFARLASSSSGGCCCRQGSKARMVQNHHGTVNITLTSRTGLSEEIES